VLAWQAHDGEFANFIVIPLVLEDTEAPKFMHLQNSIIPEFGPNFAKLITVMSGISSVTDIRRWNRTGNISSCYLVARSIGNFKMM
jgi:hypothetical protein